MRLPLFVFLLSRIEVSSYAIRSTLCSRGLNAVSHSKKFASTQVMADRLCVLMIMVRRSRFFDHSLISCSVRLMNELPRLLLSYLESPTMSSFSDEVFTISSV